MASGVNGKISAAPARAYTERDSSFQLPPGLLTSLLLVSFVGFAAWAYQATHPPPSKICGSPDGPPITAPRIKLRDGRHLAYKEHGVPKKTANYKFVFVHGYDSCRHDAVLVTELSPGIAEELGIYVLSFDRPGYGESDPDPNRTVKSLALDVEELADQLELGSKFYISGFSMGGQAVWGCLKYIPHRLAGAILIAPVVNHWWPGLPANLTKEVYRQLFRQDQWALGVAHNAPWLTYWWQTQKWFPACSVAAHAPHILSPQDKQLTSKYAKRNHYMAHIRQQGEYETVHRDLKIGFGTWEFDPILDLENPFPNNEGSVHLWQGDEDRMVPVKLQRYIAQKLPWIHYHELPGAGHMFPYADGLSDAMVKALLLGDK